MVPKVRSPPPRLMPPTVVFTAPSVQLYDTVRRLSPHILLAQHVRTFRYGIKQQKRRIFYCVPGVELTNSRQL